MTGSAIIHFPEVNTVEVEMLRILKMIVQRVWFSRSRWRFREHGQSYDASSHQEDHAHCQLSFKMGFVEILDADLFLELLCEFEFLVVRFCSMVFRHS